MLVNSVSEWVILAIGAVIVGSAKTALPGVGILPVVIFATVLPAKPSTGVLLILLIVGDIVAVSLYRTNVDWVALRRLIPSVTVGLVLGSGFLLMADNSLLRPVIGITLVLLAMLGVTRWIRSRSAQKRAGESASTLTDLRPSVARSWSCGILGGIATMVANAAGPVMSIYFIASGFSVVKLLGTSAWYYFVINLAKVPFSVGLGIITPSGLLLDLTLVPAVLVGALVGRSLARRINRNWFEVLIYLVTLFSAVSLLIPK